MDLIDYLISQDMDVNATSHFGMPLLIAAIENLQEAMQKLLRLEANLNASPDGMLSPLHASILNCSLKCVKTLLLAGADPNIKSCGVSPLEAAIKCGDKMIGLLLENGAFQNVGDDEAIARLDEIQNYNKSELNLSSFEEIRMLFRAKLAVFHRSNLSRQIPDQSMTTDILEAVRHGDIKQFERLISQLHSKRVNLPFDVKSAIEKTSFLHFAAAMGHNDMCEYILSEFKFDIDIKDFRGCTPLHMAVFANKIETIFYLLGHGTDLNAITFMGQTALHQAAGAGNLDVMDLLIGKGFDVNVATYFGTPLRSAAIHYQDEAMEKLLNNGAKPNEFQEYSPLCDAIISTSYNCMEQLLLAKADPNKKLFEASPLEVAVLYGNKKIQGLLLEQGANANERNVEDLTPLALAALEGNEEMAEEGGLPVAVGTSNDRIFLLLHLAQLSLESRFHFPSQNCPISHSVKISPRS